MDLRLMGLRSSVTQSSQDQVTARKLAVTMARKLDITSN